MITQEIKNTIRKFEYQESLISEESKYRKIKDRMIYQVERNFRMVLKKCSAEQEKKLRDIAYKSKDIAYINKKASQKP